MSAEKYAADVVDGKIVAGPHITAVCRRHLDDLEHGSKRGLWYDEEQANAGIDFVASMPITTGAGEGKPMGLFPWGKFAVGSIYGWRNDDGKRRFRKIYLESSKGSGKSPIAAAMALIAICADNEASAEAYVAARTAEQAGVAFRMMSQMVKHRPDLGIRVTGGVTPYMLTHVRSGSFAKRMSSDNQARGKSGILPSFVLLDEYHEQESSAMAEFLQSGFKSRSEPLMITTSNAGTGFDTPCGVEHEYAARVAGGEATNDAYLPLIFSLDKKDDPWNDEDCWIKSNPSLPHLPGTEYVRDRVNEARGIPGKATTVERLNFSRWESGGANAWISRELWEKVLVDNLSPEDERKKVPTYLGVDLSRSKDLTAVSVCWDFGDYVETDTTAFTPADTMAARADAESTPYPDWVEHGCLRAIPGSVIDHDVVAEHIIRLCRTYDVRAIAVDQYDVDRQYAAYDKAGFDYARDDNAQGVRIILHPQQYAGFSRTSEGRGPCMPRSIDYLEGLIVERKIRVLRNPALQSAVMGAKVTHDTSGTLRAFSKPKSGTKIDPLIGLAMAAGTLEFYKMHRSGGVDLSKILPGFKR